MPLVRRANQIGASLRKEIGSRMFSPVITVIDDQCTVIDFDPVPVLEPSTVVAVAVAVTV
jgi:hypothetical protein